MSKKWQMLLATVVEPHLLATVAEPHLLATVAGPHGWKGDLLNNLRRKIILRTSKITFVHIY